ncbi:thioesterase II family protein [Robbsia andropogonis]|uniref:thioesterase II family protein n=1 Tax=Robbsia andropogonis TaxID=28092 RepID=UPI00209D9291|nr:alpha/beta fold hydrolase [Robbsia andropogonis]MCP1121467.1 thioesterase domain-containing protein [Robbsia andropogonis]MCP1131080.1 thioesterase domain-containing protein [Robbsia andropogonis]
MSIPKKLPLLICLPYAGAGPSVFNNWRAPLQDSVQMVLPSLAGKEKRFAEAPSTKITDSVNDIAGQLRDQLAQNPEAPVIIFGHSLGAIQAYELARRIASGTSRRAVHLVVSGSASPLLKRRGKASGLSDEEFVREVESLAGYTHPALANREMRGLLLPALRADVEMHESYVHEWAAPSDINVTCVHGKGDEIVKASEAEQWRDVTQGSVDLLYAEGAHMFWVNDTTFLISKIKAVATNLAAQDVKNAA